jgi:hypothetical protein
MVKLLWMSACTMMGKRDLKTGGAALDDKSWSGGACTSLIRHNIYQVDELICGN